MCKTSQVQDRVLSSWLLKKIKFWLVLTSKCMLYHFHLEIEKNGTVLMANKLQILPPKHVFDRKHFSHQKMKNHRQRKQFKPVFS